MTGGSIVMSAVLTRRAGARNGAARRGVATCDGPRPQQHQLVVALGAAAGALEDRRQHGPRLRTHLPHAPLPGEQIAAAPWIVGLIDGPPGDGERTAQVEPHATVHRAHEAEFGVGRHTCGHLDRELAQRACARHLGLHYAGDHRRPGDGKRPEPAGDQHRSMAPESGQHDGERAGEPGQQQQRAHRVALAEPHGDLERPPILRMEPARRSEPGLARTDEQHQRDHAHRDAAGPQHDAEEPRRARERSLPLQRRIE
jgi:hypothetical protein